MEPFIQATGNAYSWFFRVGRIDMCRRSSTLFLRRGPKSMHTHLIILLGMLGMLIS